MALSRKLVVLFLVLSLTGIICHAVIHASFLASACGESSIGRNVVYKDSAKKPKHKVTTKERKERQDAFEKIKSKSIGFNLYKFRDITIYGAFNLDSALIKLFPGNHYEFWNSSDDSIDFENWQSPLTPRHSYKDDCDREVPLDFPMEGMNETFVHDTLIYNLDGKRHIIASFSTAHFVDDFYNGGGRYVGACLGLASFIEEGGNWKLEAFCPALGFYGESVDLSPIHRINLGKHTIACLLGSYVSGASQPIYINAFIFEIQGNTFKILFQKDNVCRTYRQRNVWDTWFDIDTLQMDSLFPDIITTSYGDYLRSGFDSTMQIESPEEASDAVQNVAKQHDDFDFTLTDRYRFNGKKYKLVKENIHWKHHHGKNKKLVEKPSLFISRNELYEDH